MDAACCTENMLLPDISPKEKVMETCEDLFSSLDVRTQFEPQSPRTITCSCRMWLPTAVLSVTLSYLLGIPAVSEEVSEAEAQQLGGPVYGCSGGLVPLCAGLWWPEF